MTAVNPFGDVFDVHKREPILIVSDEIGFVETKSDTGVELGYISRGHDNCIHTLGGGSCVLYLTNIVGVGCRKKINYHRRISAETTRERARHSDASKTFSNFSGSSSLLIITSSPQPLTSTNGVRAQRP